MGLQANIVKRNKRQIWSADACKHIAADLFEQAKKWEKRAHEIENFRGNIRPLEDAAPAMKAAERVFVAMQNDIDPIQYCGMICNRYYLEYSQVWMLYEHKRTAWERERIKERNRTIIKMHVSGFKNVDLAERFSLSKGQISKIINASKKKAPRRRDALT